MKFVHKSRQKTGKVEKIFEKKYKIRKIKRKPF